MIKNYRDIYRCATITQINNVERLYALALGPGSTVITESTALKLLGNENPATALKFENILYS